ncbi:transposase, IS4, partial [Nitratireductor aquibiodomus RA22]
FTKVKVRGRPKVAAVFGFAVAAYNLVRLPKLLAQAAT